MNFFKQLFFFGERTPKRLVGLPEATLFYARADAGEQFARAERLNHVIVGASVDGFAVGLFTRARGQKDDRDRSCPAVGFQVPATGRSRPISAS